MSKSLLPDYQPLAPLRFIRTLPHGFLLRSKSGFCRVTAISPAIFRFQHVPTQADLDRPSWGVAHQLPSPSLAKVNRRGHTVIVQTSRGRFTLNLRTGSWNLRDEQNAAVFECGAAATSVSKTGAQISLALARQEAIFGLGETTGTYNKRGLVREFWNIDVLGHAPAIHPSLRTLYVSIPFAISLRNGRAGGLFWDNPARQSWDLGQTSLDRRQIKAYSPDMDLYLLMGPQISEVVANYTELTGRIPLPPAWSLGYQQCRYSYETQARVEQLARQFRRKRIPCDVLYLDIHYMDEYRVFTFGKAFPAPSRMCARLRREGFKVVTIVDPGVKDDPSFDVCRRGIRHRALIKAPNAKRDFIGKVWPGPSRFPDFLNASAREWWGTEQGKFQAIGINGFWNDMNEPANFGSDTKTLPEACVHQSDFGPVSHAQAHNVYGMQMARASREGALATRPNERPFVITRAAYAGTQRYALVWTGDNSSVWEHLADSIQMLLNLGLSGMPVCGSDVGGFLDNTTPELLTRWLQMAVFTPFLRNHSNIRTIDQEPWSFGPETEAILRRYIELRYQLLPLLYSLFAEARDTAAPIMRPLLWHYQGDPVAAAVSDQFLLGSHLMVAPIIRQGEVARCVYLPAGDWFDFWTGACSRGANHVVAPAPINRIPVFVRAGGLIPMGPVQQYVGERSSCTMALHCWPGQGHFNWYEDDGQTNRYQDGVFHRRAITLTPIKGALVLRFSAVQGEFPSRYASWRILVHAASSSAQAFFEGTQLPAKFNTRTKVLSLTIPNSVTEFSIHIEGALHWKSQPEPA